MIGRSVGRAARRWGPPVNSTDFADLPQHGNACNRLLDMPRVALLFLSLGHMHHDETWARWFEGVKGLIPKPTLQVNLLEYKNKRRRRAHHALH